MTRIDAQAILALYREGIDDPGDPLFAGAVALAERDPELARWLAAEQRFDRRIAGELERGLSDHRAQKNFLLQQELPGRPPVERPLPSFKWLAWAVPALMLAVSLMLFLRSGRDLEQLRDFRSEMVGFIRIPPSLELKSPDVGEMTDWLRTRLNVSTVKIPVNTRQQLPVGCRTLIFRGQPVALVCFLRKDHQFVHLMAINASAFKGISLGRSPEFAQEGEWMTGTWREGDMVYMLTTKGSREDLAKYL